MLFFFSFSSCSGLVYVGGWLGGILQRLAVYYLCNTEYVSVGWPWWRGGHVTFMQGFPTTLNLVDLGAVRCDVIRCHRTAWTFRVCKSGQAAVKRCLVTGDGMDYTMHWGIGAIRRQGAQEGLVRHAGRLVASFPGDELQAFNLRVSCRWRERRTVNGERRALLPAQGWESSRRSNTRGSSGILFNDILCSSTSCGRAGFRW